MLLDVQMYINVFIDFLYQKITSMIAYFAPVAKYPVNKNTLDAKK